MTSPNKPGNVVPMAIPRKKVPQAQQAQAQAQAQAVELLTWMRARFPHVYKGVAQRFSTPQQAQLSGFWDSVGSIAGNVATGVSNFLSSQGAEKLLQVAQPFIQSKVEREQIELNLKRIQSGQPIRDYSVPDGNSPGYPTVPGIYSTGVDLPRISWGLIGGIAGGVGLLLLLTRRRS